MDVFEGRFESSGKNTKKRPKRPKTAFLGVFRDFTPIGEKSQKTPKKAVFGLFDRFWWFSPDRGKIPRSAQKGHISPFWTFFEIFSQKSIFSRHAGAQCMLLQLRWRSDRLRRPNIVFFCDIFFVAAAVHVYVLHFKRSAFRIWEDGLAAARWAWADEVVGSNPAIIFASILNLVITFG